MSAIRDQLPAAIQSIMQNGLLERAFQEALRPQLLYPLAGDLMPVSGRVGSKITQTRNGLLTPQTTSLGGTDPTPEKWSVEQWDVVLEDYGHAITTDLLAGEMSIASEFIRDAMALAQNAGQSLNHIARAKLYEAYAGGRTWVTAAATSATQTVQSIDGFEFTLAADGSVVPVSASNPIPVTVTESGTPDDTVAVIGASGNTVTLDASVTTIVGDTIVADSAPFVVNAGTGNTVANDIVAADTIDLADFRAAVVRLRQQNVPTFSGYYVAHVDSYTENQLWDDADFQNVLNTNINARQFTDLAIGTAAGIIFVRNEEVPTVTTEAGLTVHRPIVMGARSLINAPFQGYEAALRSNPALHADITFVDVGVSLPVAYIVNPSTDIMNRFINQAWGWVGDFGVPSDSVTGDAALFKRAVLLQHA